MIDLLGCSFRFHAGSVYEKMHVRAANVLRLNGITVRFGHHVEFVQRNRGIQRWSEILRVRGPRLEKIYRGEPKGDLPAAWGRTELREPEEEVEGAGRKRRKR